MTDSEIELFALAVKLRKDYLDCNPDVGMGPSIDMIIEWVSEQTGVATSVSNKQEIIEIVNSW